ncbi:hypothetical protein D1007_57989 [Hordeum vulgare]|nr:hypothetical protein D1007_57989 [Hordeum vulgare]
MTGRGGWGFAAHDEDGAIRGSGLGVIPRVASALQAEATACGEAVQAAALWGMGSIILETDSQILAKALGGTEFDLTPEGIIFRDLRSFIRLSFISVDVCFAQRGCNKLAHELAALGSGQVAECVVWLDYVPDSVSSNG